MVHLFFASVAIVLILACACKILFINQGSSAAEWAGIFGSSGIMGVALSRVLSMFDKALEYVGKGRQ